MHRYAILSETDLRSPLSLPSLVEGLYCFTTPDIADQTIPEQAEVVFYLPDALIAQCLHMAHLHQWTVTILPHKEALHAGRGFCLGQSRTQGVNFTDTDTVAMDVLFCNEKLVLNKVVLGRAFSFQPGGHSRNLWLRLKTMWRQVQHFQDYQPQSFKLKSNTSEASIDTAALGITAMTHAFQSNLSKQLLPDRLLNDGMFYSLIVAPKSVLEMVYFLIIQPFSKNVTQSGFLGLLRTTGLTVESPKPFSLHIDGVESQIQRALIEIQPGYIQLRVAKPSPLLDGVVRTKEIRRVHNLPSAKESIHALVTKPLPWITHAATDEFRELYQTLREQGQVTSTFMIFMVLSTLLASFGLYANSAPVIIGAMILAPLMAPIISLSMAFTRQDASLLQSSARTLFIGLMVAMGFAMVLSWLLPLQVQTPEIASRLRPTLLDLGVAIISGIAGAYSHARVQAAKSLAGVAIAVALVPPLAVTGIGLGWLSPRVFLGSFLLFVTNLAGIVLAASVTFLMLGFAPFSRARKGIIIALAAVLLVSIPLAFSFNQLAKEAAIVSAIENIHQEDLDIRAVRVISTVAPVRVSMEVVSNGVLDSVKVRALKQRVQNELDTEVSLEVSWISRY